MNNWQRTGTWTVVGVLSVGLASGVTWAAASSPSSTGASAAPAAAARSTTGQPGNAHRRTATGSRSRRHSLLRRVEYGQLTLRKGGATMTVDLQRGTLTAVSPTSVTVRSRDGHTGTYAITSTTRIRSDRKLATSAALVVGHRVGVRADGHTAVGILAPTPGQHAAPDASASSTT